MSSTNKRNTSLRKLKKHEIEQFRDRFIASARQEDRTNYQSFDEALLVKTQVDLPLGELANPAMRDLVLVWALTRTFEQNEITEQHQLNAQGLEGLVSISDVPLAMALLAAIKTGLSRIEIFVPSGWRWETFQNGKERVYDDNGLEWEEETH